MFNSTAATSALVLKDANPRVLWHMHLNLHQWLRTSIVVMIDLDPLHNACAVIVLHLRSCGSGMVHIADAISSLNIEISAIGVLRQSRRGCNKRLQNSQWLRLWKRK